MFNLDLFYRQVSPVRSVKYDSSDDNSSLISRRRVADSAKKIVKSSTKSKNCMPKIHCEQAIHPIKGLVYDRQGAETGISRDSLPSSLVELGKVLSSSVVNSHNLNDIIEKFIAITLPSMLSCTAGGCKAKRRCFVCSC